MWSLDQQHQHHLRVGYRYRTRSQAMFKFNEMARCSVYLLTVETTCFNTFRCYTEVPRKTGLGLWGEPSGRRWHLGWVLKTEQKLLRWRRTFQAELQQVQGHERPGWSENSMWSRVAGTEGGKWEVFYVPLLQPKQKTQDQSRSLVPAVFRT